MASVDVGERCLDALYWFSTCFSNAVLFVDDDDDDDDDSLGNVCFGADLIWRSIPLRTCIGDVVAALGILVCAID